ncbi:MAG: VCBS repeat-containing protein [Candidatus Hydrogenedentes bacterium]|nr:VCBS repeat-containing protein [Candidatus Hydrogenedentota bacterium]
MNRNRVSLLCALLAALYINAAVQAQTPSSPPPIASPITFEKQVIDAAFENGYQVSAADVDGDGKLDVLALSTTPSQLVWYRNSSWERFSITTQTKLNIDLAPSDIDGDGDVDVALASEFDLNDSTAGGLVEWLDNPGDPAAQQDWRRYRIDAIPTAHRVRWADIDGDGKRELLVLPIIGVGAKAPDHTTGVRFVAYRVPQNPKEEAWPALEIDSKLTTAHGLAVVRWDNNERDDILTASFDGLHLFRYDPKTQTWGKERLGSGNRMDQPKQGSSEVGMGNRKEWPGRFMAAIEPWHGNEVVVYDPVRYVEDPWRRIVIDSTFNDGHALAVADFDKDGNDEIVAGYRGAPYALYLYNSVSGTRDWQRAAIDEGGVAASGVVVADIDNDGNPDILVAGASTNNVVWYRNRGKSGP